MKALLSIPAILFVIFCIKLPYALAVSPETIVLHHIDSENYPQISVHLTLISPEKRLQVTSQDIEVIENGHAVSNFQLLQEVSPGIVWAFVLDRSDGIHGSDVFEEFLATFVQNLAPQDQLALVVFGGEVKVAQFGANMFTADKSAFVETLENLQVDSSGSRFFDSLYEALTLFDSPPNFLIHRAIIVFTDGNDEGSTKTTDEVEQKIKELQQENLDIQILTLGTPSGFEDNIFKLNMRHLSEMSGGRYFDMNDFSSQQALNTIKKRLQSRFVAKYESEVESSQSVEVIVRSKTMPDIQHQREYKMMFSTSSSEPEPESTETSEQLEPGESPAESTRNTEQAELQTEASTTYLFLIIGGGIGILFLIGGIWGIRRRSKTTRRLSLSSETTSAKKTRDASSSTISKSLSTSLGQASVNSPGGDTKLETQIPGQASVNSPGGDTKLETQIDPTKLETQIDPNLGIQGDHLMGSHQFYGELETGNVLASLEIIEGIGTGMQFKLTSANDKISIGSLNNPEINQLVLREPTVSRIHAVLTNNNGSFSIENKSKTNPLKINHQSIQRAILKNQDQVTIGSLLFKFTKYPG